MTKYELNLSPEKYAELLTQITAGLLASGHFTLRVAEDCEGNPVTEDSEDQVIRYLHRDIGGPGRDGYTGPPAAILVAVDILQSIKLEVESRENDEE